MKKLEQSWEPVLKEIREAPVVKRPRGNPGSAPHGLYYKNIICAFDIETSNIDGVNSIMYSWQFCADNAELVTPGGFGGGPGMDGGMMPPGGPNGMGMGGRQNRGAMNGQGGRQNRPGRQNP